LAIPGSPWIGFDRLTLSHSRLQAEATFLSENLVVHTSVINILKQTYQEYTNDSSEMTPLIAFALTLTLTPLTAHLSST